MNWAILLFIGIFCFAIISNCRRTQRPEYNNYDVTIQQTTTTDAADGLNLVAVGELVQEVQNGESLEQKLNDPNTKINNLDLNADGRTDYIKVTEYGSGNIKGFSLTTELSTSEEQEIATIEIEKTSDGYANVQTHGNRNIYGQNHYYHSRVSLTDMLIIGWLFSDRPYYRSPWHYGYYPSHYRAYPVRTRTAYNRDISGRVSSSTLSPSSRSTMSSPVQSPNATKTASNIKAPLRSPTTAQKSFQARSTTKTVSSGGFGSRSSTPSNPSIRTSSGSSTRSGSFSGGK